jgi:ABC-type branched-subunit amino acid transport system ATPase component
MTFKWPKPFTEMTFDEKMRHVDRVCVEDPLIEKVETKLGESRTEGELRTELEKLKAESARLKAKAEKSMERTPVDEQRRVDAAFEEKHRAMGRGAVVRRDVGGGKGDQGH